MAATRGRPPTRNAQPWNVLYPREYQVQGQGPGPETRTDFLRVGVAFPMQNRQGFSIELFLMPPTIEGRARLVIMPREQSDEHGT
jgi:hypothetical protein